MNLSIKLNQNSVSTLRGESYIQTEIIFSLLLNLFYSLFARCAWSNSRHNDKGL